MFAVSINKREGAALIDTKMQEASFRMAVEKHLIKWLGGRNVIPRAPRL